MVLLYVITDARYVINDANLGILRTTLIPKIYLYYDVVSNDNEKPPTRIL